MLNKYTEQHFRNALLDWPARVGGLTTPSDEVPVGALGTDQADYALHSFRSVNRLHGLVHYLFFTRRCMKASVEAFTASMEASTASMKAFMEDMESTMDKRIQTIPLKHLLNASMEASTERVEDASEVTSMEASTTSTKASTEASTKASTKASTDASTKASTKARYRYSKWQRLPYELWHLQGIL